MGPSESPKLIARMKSQAELIVELCGGLGNQMFQYAAARSLAKRCGAQLVIDAWSGFIRDYQYRRSYELESFPISARVATPLERMPFWMDRVGRKLRLTNRLFAPVTSHWYGVLLRETRSAFQPNVFEYQIKEACWMTGYWQTPRYFDCCQDIIRCELMPTPPSEPHYLEMGQIMHGSNSVAIGIRLYEESVNPGSHAREGRLKSIADVNGAIRQLAQHYPDLHFFLFCTHRSPALGQLQLPGKVTHLTHDDGFDDAASRLWLLTQCRHHIMTNSSFYWWGAYLSKGNYPSEMSEIFAADNFINKDCIPSQWKLF